MCNTGILPHGPREAHHIPRSAHGRYPSIQSSLLVRIPPRDCPGRPSNPPYGRKPRSAPTKFAIPKVLRLGSSQPSGRMHPDIHEGLRFQLRGPATLALTQQLRRSGRVAAPWTIPQYRSGRRPLCVRVARRWFPHCPPRHHHHNNHRRGLRARYYHRFT